MSSPTTGVPLMTGAVFSSTALSSKWMKPDGQLPPALVSVRQWKSPLQLSSEMTILVAERTRWTKATWPLEPAPGAFFFHQATAPTIGVWSVIDLFAGPQL